MFVVALPRKGYQAAKPAHVLVHVTETYFVGRCGKVVMARNGALHHVVPASTVCGICH